MTTDLVRDFSEAIMGPDQQVDLFGAAMVIARISGEPVAIHETARELDLIGEAVREHAGPTLDPEALTQAIDHELFVIRGFHGNAGNYSDPENSYLDRVVARRTGIPITLSLVYMEVASRVGLRCDGIGYPGHFLVRCGPPEQPLFIDPFQQAVRLDRGELLSNLRSYDLRGASPDSYLAAVTRRQILQRMLNNLHAVLRERRDAPRWLATIELLLCLEPWNAGLVGERGMLNYRLGRPQQALEDLERYVGAGETMSVSAGARRLLDELRLRFGGTEG